MAAGLAPERSFVPERESDFGISLFSAKPLKKAPMPAKISATGGPCGRGDPLFQFPLSLKTTKNQKVAVRLLDTRSA